MKLSRFTLSDDNTVFQAYKDQDEDTAGWAHPFFTKEQVEIFLQSTDIPYTFMVIDEYPVLILYLGNGEFLVSESSPIVLEYDGEIEILESYNLTGFEFVEVVENE